ncbi:MAG: RelA/SpoT AH/RIS domain-containing protein, partial [Pseudomonadota bacterium]
VPGYEALTVTGRARGAQRRLRRDQETREFTNLGRHMLERALRQVDIDPIGVDMLEVSERADYASVEAMFEAIGRSRDEIPRLVSKAFPGAAQAHNPDVAPTTLDDEHAAALITGTNLTPGVTLHLGQCCHPLPGDRIIGLHEPDKGLVVHTIFCGTVARYDDRPDLWVDLKWNELARSGVRAVARVEVNAADTKGVMAQQCSVVAQAGGNIIGVSTKDRTGDFMTLVFDIEVEDLRHFEQIKAALRTLAVVERVERLEESHLEQ